MKFYRLFPILPMLIFILACQKNSAPVSPAVFGPEVNGLRCSITLDNTHLNSGKPATVTLIIQNTAIHPIQQNAYCTFTLYDSRNIQRYLAYFDVMANQANALYKSSWAHSETFLNIAGNKQLTRQIDLTRMGWVQPQDSKPPSKSFYDEVGKGSYTLYFELDLSDGTVIKSNGLKVVVE